MINKSILIRTLQKLMEEKLVTIDKLISDLRSSNTDTKSSMGDKYETSREMLNQEINRLLNQKKIIVKQKNIANNLKENIYNKVKFGSLISSDFGSIFISVSLGELELNGEKIIAISEESPLAGNLLGLQKGDSFEINKKKYQILSLD